jgi:beta-lactamase regulating signal transducer with metallopeptidase domain
MFNEYEPLPPPLLLQQLGWTILHFYWQGAIIALVFYAATKLRPFRSSQRRYAIGLIAVAAMAILPMVTFYCIGQSALHTLDGAAASNWANVQRIDFVFGQVNRFFGNLRWFDRLITWVLAIWFLGILLVALRYIAGWAVLQRILRKDSVPIDQQRFDHLAHRLPIARTIRFLESSWIDVPATVGWIKPVVLLPRGTVESLARQQLDALIVHELAHIRRTDYLVNLVQSVLEILTFCHPASWWISAKVRAYREHCCDDEAVAAIGSKRLYLDALATVEELRGSRLSRHALSADGGDLIDRASRLLGDPSRSLFGQGKAVGAAAFIVAILLFVVGAQAFEHSAIVYRLRSTERSKSFSAAVAATLDVPVSSSTSFLSDLENAVPKGDTTSAQAVAALAADLVAGQDSDALSTQMQQIATVNRPTLRQAAWHFGEAIDRGRLTDLLWENAKRSEDPSAARDWARAALLLAAQSSFQGIGSFNRTLFDPRFCAVAEISNQQMIALRQLAIDHEAISRAFSKAELVLIGPYADKLEFNERLSLFSASVRLVDHRPDLQLRLAQMARELVRAGGVDKRDRTVAQIRTATIALDDSPTFSKWREQSFVLSEKPKRITLNSRDAFTVVRRPKLATTRAVP